MCFEHQLQILIKRLFSHADVEDVCVNRSAPEIQSLPELGSFHGDENVQMCKLSSANELMLCMMIKNNNNTYLCGIFHRMRLKGAICGGYSSKAGHGEITVLRS